MTAFWLVVAGILLGMAGFTTLGYSHHVAPKIMLSGVVLFLCGVVSL